MFAGARRDEGLEAIAAAADGRRRGSTCIPVLVDVTDDASVAAAFSQILADGPVDVLVNNAGITGSGSVEETAVDTYRAMFDTNVLGVVRCTQQVLPSMRAAGRGSHREHLVVVRDPVAAADGRRTPRRSSRSRD